MTDNYNAHVQQQPPKPSPALKRLDRLVGTWKASDPSGAGAIRGQVTFEWLEGGFFLRQHVDLGGSKGIEIIGYDEESKAKIALLRQCWECLQLRVGSRR